MNTGKAKQIRKQIYGDMSHRNRYYTRDAKGTIRAIGLRAEYQKAKKER